MLKELFEVDISKDPFVVSRLKARFNVRAWVELTRSKKREQLLIASSVDRQPTLKEGDISYK